MSETSRIFSVQPASVSGIKTFDEMEQDQDNMKHISKKAGLQKICKISYEEFKRITEKANSIAITHWESLWIFPSITSTTLN